MTGIKKLLDTSPEGEAPLTIERRYTFESLRGQFTAELYTFERGKQLCITGLAIWAGFGDFNPNDYEGEKLPIGRRASFAGSLLMMDLLITDMIAIAKEYDAAIIAYNLSYDPEYQTEREKKKAIIYNIIMKKYGCKKAELCEFSGWELPK